MGQYHYVCNLDKHEFLHPHHMGDGLKLLEFGCSAEGTLTGLTILLAASNGRGGGDLHIDADSTLGQHIVGRWVGDRIAIIGDYYEDGDVPGWDMRDNPWNVGDDDPSAEYAKGWTNISTHVRAAMATDSYMGQSMRKTWAEDENPTTLHPDGSIV